MGSVFENERRHYKQFPDNVDIRFRRLDLSGVLKELKTFQAILASAGHVTELGVFLITQELQPADAIIELAFHFEPQGRDVKSLARVTWVCQEKTQKGLGVELLKVPQDLYESVVTRAKRGNWIEVIKEPEEKP
jgi:hypothetical protein